MAHIKAAVMAQYARTYIILFFLHKLCDPLRISKELSCKTCAVDLSLRDRFRRDAWIHSACADHRNINKLTNMFHIFKITVFRHIDGRMRPVPCIVGTVVAV